jgi:hypothetical protein
VAALAGCLAATAGACGKVAQLVRAAQPAPLWQQSLTIAWLAAHVTANAIMTVCFVRALQRLPAIHATVVSIASNMLLTVRLRPAAMARMLAPTMS